MSDAVLFWGYWAIAALVATAWNSVITWQEMQTGKDMLNERAPTVLVIVWPVVIGFCVVVGVGYLLCYRLPRRLMLSLIERRKRIAESERAAKLEADSRRYVDSEALR